MDEPKVTGDDLTGGVSRIDFLLQKVKDSKKVVSYWEELATQETCLMHGQIYRIKSDE